MVVLGEKSLLVGRSHFQIMDAFAYEISDTQASVGQRPVLTDRLLLDRPQIGERIAAWVVVVLSRRIKPPRVNTAVGLEHACPGRRENSRLDLRALVGGADRTPLLIEDVQLSNAFGFWNHDRVNPRLT